MRRVNPVVQGTFFETPNYIEYAQTLKIYKEQNIAFNTDDVSHMRLIVDHSNAAQKALAKLLNIDYRIGLSLAVGVSAFMLSTLLPLSAVAMAGFTYAAYLFGLRKQAELEHQAAGRILLECANWSLGTINDIEPVRNCPAIVRMIKTLAPIASPQQLQDAIDDKYELGFIQDAQAIADTQKEPLFGTDTVLSKEESALFYGIYGIGQGGALDIMKGFYYILTKLGHHATEYVKSRMNQDHQGQTPFAAR